MKHIKQLDSIRAIAVIMVIVSHWIPKFHILPWGEIGVDIFFVLSGFLISRILFDNKQQNIDSGLSRGHILKNFIIRRTLRIFPVYYFVLFIHYIFASETGTHVQENIEYYLFYSSNILFFISQKLDGIASHFWSLAVEEQFYLFWPWIVLFLSRRALPYVMISFVILGTIIPILFPFPHIGKLTPSCLNAFAMGSLLAYVSYYGVEIKKKWNTYFVVTCLILVLTLPFHAIFHFEYYPVRLIISILSVGIIKYCLYDNDIKIFNYFLNQRILIFIGKISYGIYLYHTIIPWFWRVLYQWLLGRGIDFHSIYFFVPKFLHNDLDLVVKFFILIFVSWCSWIFFESPINRLKKYFEYKPALASQSIVQ
jgi:peptidoglycan/LPS O-acetylase OafA/YrhL